MLTDVDSTAYDAAWDVLDEVFEAACETLAKQGWKRLALDERRLELEDAEAALSREEQEAIEAEFAAAREKAEYDAAVETMERERAEMEEAEAAALDVLQGAVPPSSPPADQQRWPYAPAWRWEEEEEEEPWSLIGGCCEA